MGRRIFVGNLSWNTDTNGLRDAFANFGTVKDAKVIEDRETGRSRGFGFVEFTTDQEAQNAITQMNGQDLDGRQLKVNEAEERTRTGGGGGGRSGGGAPRQDYNAAPSGGGGRGGGGRGGGKPRRGREDKWD